MRPTNSRRKASRVQDDPTSLRVALRGCPEPRKEVRKMADETQQLLNRIKRQGYTPSKSSEGHYQVFDPSGQLVRLETGQPFHFAATPSDHHAIQNSEATLRKLGVLPAKNGGKKLTKREVLKEHADQLRTELQQLMKDHDYKQSDIYHFADEWAAAHGIGVPVQSAGVVSKLLKGHSLSDPSYQWLSAAMSAIRRNNGIIPSMEHPGVRQPQPEPEETGIQVEGESPERVKLPRLALDVMQTIYKEEKDHDAIMALVEEIAKLEMK